MRTYMHISIIVLARRENFPGTLYSVGVAAIKLMHVIKPRHI